MGRRVEYYCDCCNKQVNKEKHLTTIETTFGSTEGIQHREVCFDCWKEYTNKIAKVAKELFK